MMRLARVEDAARIAEIYAPIVRDTAISFEEVPPSSADIAARITGLARDGFPWLVYAPDDVVAGYGYATKHRERAAYRWCVEVSVYVHAEHRKRGVARGLYTSLFAILQLQGYRNAYAGITLPNPPSVELHRALGFELVGVYHDVGYKAGAWRDVAWYSLTLMPGAGPPSEPRRYQELSEEARWAAALRLGEDQIRGRS